MNLDLIITKSIQAIQIPGFSELMQFVSAIGYTPYNGLVIGSITCLLFIFRFRWEAVLSVINAVGISVIGLGLKYIVHRPRPSADIVNVVRQLDSYSFPSSHVLFYAAYFGFLFFLTYTIVKKNSLRNVLLAIELFFIILVGPSRIYLGAHWFSDVVGAYIIAGFWLFGIIAVYQKGNTHFSKTL